MINQIRYSHWPCCVHVSHLMGIYLAQKNYDGWLSHQKNNLKMACVKLWLLLLEQIWRTFNSFKRCPLIMCMTTKPKILPLPPVLVIAELLKGPCASQVQSCSYVNVKEKGEKSKLIPPSEKKAELKNRLEWCFCPHPTDEIWSISHILLSKTYWGHTLQDGTFVTKWNVSCRCQDLYVINNVFSGVDVDF